MSVLGVRLEERSVAGNVPVLLELADGSETTGDTGAFGRLNGDVAFRDRGGRGGST